MSQRGCQREGSPEQQQAREIGNKAFAAPLDKAVRGEDRLSGRPRPQPLTERLDEILVDVGQGRSGRILALHKALGLRRLERGNVGLRKGHVLIAPPEQRSAIGEIVNLRAPVDREMQQQQAAVHHLATLIGDRRDAA